MRHIKTGLAALAALLLMTACRSAKIASNLDGPHPEQARFEHVVKYQQYGYEAMQSKSKYHMGSSSLGGRLCLESGKRLCLLVNAPLLGFEIARVEASQDSIVVVDKYDKQYSVVDPSTLYNLPELQGHELEAIECIVMGRIYIPGQGPATARDYKYLDWATPTRADGTLGNTVGVYQGSGYTLRYDIDAQGRLACTTLTMDHRTVKCEYTGYQEVEKGKWMPTSDDVTVIGASGKQVRVGLSLTSPELGESTWRDFEPSSSYKRVEIDEMVKTAKTLIK